MDMKDQLMQILAHVSETVGADPEEQARMLEVLMTDPASFSEQYADILDDAQKGLLGAL